ncbi:MAG: ATP-binding protein, partial [Bacteroidota bacterium]|nr:ATP-binding protein [Bacteroidota bacterium]
IKHFNLREIFIVNYQHFIQAFLGIDYSKGKEDVKERRQYNLKVFNLTVDTLKGLEVKSLDPFSVMKKEMQKTADKGVRPVIIIDELQALDGIYLNGQRELLKELFNFFVAMTKESHLCHVMIASSDGYFIERIYNDSKLKKTSRFLEVEYLTKDDVMFRLGDLQGQSKIKNLDLSDVQKETIWDTFGGSCWEINEFLSDLLRVAQDGTVQQEDFAELVAGKKVATRSMFVDYAGLFKDKRKLFFCNSLSS